MKRTLLLISGYSALFLGVLGIVVPLLPTTPFLLLAASCFMRSSKPMYNWLISHRYLGRHIFCYREYRAVTAGSKLITLLILWFVMGLTVFTVIQPVWLKVLLPAIALGVTAHVGPLRRVTPEMLKEYEKVNRNHSPCIP